jgi:hypothetical protein
LLKLKLNWVLANNWWIPHDQGVDLACRYALLPGEAGPPSQKVRSYKPQLFITINALVGFGGAWAPVHCAHPSFYAHLQAQRGAAPPPQPRYTKHPFSPSLSFSAWEGEISFLRLEICKNLPFNPNDIHVNIRSYQPLGWIATLCSAYAWFLMSIHGETPFLSFYAYYADILIEIGILSASYSFRNQLAIATNHGDKLQLGQYVFLKINLNPISTELGCASFAYIFFITKRNAKRSHFSPSQTKTKKFNLIKLLKFFIRNEMRNTHIFRCL